MANRLYEEQMSQGMMGQFSNFMRNPFQFMAQKRINIPQEYANDPQGAVQYLLNSGQMMQSTLENLRTIAARMGIKI